ncbi:immunity 52 family protein [Archangium sp.]|jgi:hypothetical protein|uniref:immunity 52 family protein n=1 Tax=Archangium sp. TaxID=1872627 RepID=UPI002ED8A213
MNETYYVGAYWLARGESAELCARRAESFFHLLASCDPSLSHWYEKGWTQEEALKHRFSPTKDEFLGKFAPQKEGRSEDDFHLGLWNGEANGAASNISLHCGCASAWVSNFCVLNPPEEGPVAERILQAPVLARALRSMAVAWEPEWAVATSDMHRSEVLKKTKAGTFVGWLMYFSHRRGPLPPLTPPVQVEPVEDKGTLVILTPERFTATNPAHVELARDVSERLAQAGLLAPLRPWNG